MAHCLRLWFVELLRFGSGFYLCLRVERIWRGLTASSFQHVCDNVWNISYVREVHVPQLITAVDVVFIVHQSLSYSQDVTACIGKWKFLFFFLSLFSFGIKQETFLSCWAIMLRVVTFWCLIITSCVRVCLFLLIRLHKLNWNAFCGRFSGSEELHWHTL